MLSRRHSSASSTGSGDGFIKKNEVENNRGLSGGLSEGFSDDGIIENGREVTQFLIKEQDGETLERRLPVEKRTKWWKIYTLHLLFMWNTRTYEYASIVLVSLAFPQTLTATSIRYFLLSFYS
jgi:hypothetical protein